MTTFRAVLRAELGRRCAKNPRYSLRAFARSLGVDHSTLSQLLRGRRPLTPAAVKRLGRKLGLDEAALSGFASERRSEAQAVLEDGTHQAILALVGTEGFRADVRFVARALGIDADAVNVAVQRLSALGLLALEGARWVDVAGAGAMTPEAFEREVWSRAAARFSNTTPRRREAAVPSSSPVVQFQILSKDPAATSRFYAEVFGWKVSDTNPLGYRQLDTGGLSGGIWPAPPEAHNFVQLFIAVDDVAAAVERAVGQGAKVLMAPQKLPEGDELAILQDPLGVPFGLTGGNRWTSAARS